MCFKFTDFVLSSRYKTFQKTLFTLKNPPQLTFLFKPNATMKYHDSQLCNNECDNLNSYFPS